MANPAIGSSEVAPEALIAADLAPGSVGSSEVANNSLRLTDTAVTTVFAPLDLPSFSGCQTQSTFAPTVQVGDYTFVVPDGLENGLVTYGLTADTVGQARWRVCTTSGSVDPGSHTYHLIVFRF